MNKVNTKVELRLLVDESSSSYSSWMPREVLSRLIDNERNRVSKDGYLVVTSQEYRTQMQNRKDAMRKLEGMVRDSWDRPKVRKMRVGLSKKTREDRREMKRKIGLKKEGRKRVDF